MTKIAWRLDWTSHFILFLWTLWLFQFVAFVGSWAFLWNQRHKNLSVFGDAGILHINLLKSSDFLLSKSMFL